MPKNVRVAPLLLLTLTFTLACAQGDAAEISHSTSMPQDISAATAVDATVAATVGATVDANVAQAATIWTVAETGNEARYRVREQLAGRNFPNDAIGRTSAITGTIALDANGSPVRAASRFTIDVGTLASDSDRRDNFIRRRTLETETHPRVTLVPTALRGLPRPLPTTAIEGRFELIGDLTVRGVTRTTTWQVTARYDGGSTVTGAATTAFTFEDFEMTKPRVASVLSVADTIRLEYDFTLVPAEGNP